MSRQPTLHLGRSRGLIRPEPSRRVNYAARSVLTPSPDLASDQVAVPPEAARTLRFPGPDPNSDAASRRAMEALYHRLREDTDAKPAVPSGPPGGPPLDVHPGSPGVHDRSVPRPAPGDWAAIGDYIRGITMGPAIKLPTGGYEASITRADGAALQFSIPSLPLPGAGGAAGGAAGRGKPSCAVCGADADHKCGRCLQRHFCSKAHQRADWPTHKSTCMQP